jgi:hypothetical protein
MVNNKMIVTIMLIAIASLAGAGCSDDNPVNPTVVDTAPLDVPANLTLELSKGSAVLDWDPSTDHHVVGYMVTRERYGITQIMGNMAVEYSGYVDTTPLSGSSIYHVYALDNAGKMSAAASVNLTMPLIRRPARLSG